MNDEDIHEIKTSWVKPMQDPSGAGQAILIEYFTQFPSAQRFFNSFKDVPVPELKNNAKFRAHAGNIIKLFDDSINALGTDYEDSLIKDLWTKAAVSHHRRKISKKNFMELKGVIIKVLVAACDLNERQRGSWTKLLDHVYAIVFETYEELDKGVQ